MEFKLECVLVQLCPTPVSAKYLHYLLFHMKYGFHTELDQQTNKDRLKSACKKSENHVLAICSCSSIRCKFSMSMFESASNSTCSERDTVQLIGDGAFNTNTNLNTKANNSKADQTKLSNTKILAIHTTTITTSINKIVQFIQVIVTPTRELCDCVL